MPSCLVCRADLERGRFKFCSERCCSSWHYQNRQTFKPSQVNCQHCGEQFTTKHGAHKFCGPKCRTAASNGRMAQRRQADRRQLIESKLCSLCGAPLQYVPKAKVSTHACAPCRRRIETLKKHGISQERYMQMASEQGGKCRICREVVDIRKFQVDHDHECCSGSWSCGKCVRCLLCVNCNRGLGHFRDDPWRLHRAAQLLEVRARVARLMDARREMEVDCVAV